MSSFFGFGFDEMATLAPGVICGYGAASAPDGWLLCDGTAVSRTTYSGLFAIIGTTYGVGDGSTTFNVPNLKGSVPVGLDAAQTEFDVLAETGGAKTHTLTSAEMPAHTHTQDAHTHTQDAHAHVENAPSSASAGALKFGIDTNASGSQDAGISTATAVATNQNATATNQNTGGGGAHNNLQPYLVINFIIKT